MNVARTNPSELPPAEPFRRVFLFGMGFTQTARRPTGLEKLWAAHRALAAPDTWVMPPLPWNTGAAAIAALIQRHTTPDTAIYGTFYSWGGGWLFPRLAEALRATDLAPGWRRSFRAIVLVDAVYRSPYLPSWLPLNPLSLTRGALAPKIVIPPNVDHLYPFRQAVTRPSGHDLIVDAERTVLHPTTWLSAPHVAMDDQAEVHQASLALARGEALAQPL